MTEDATVSIAEPVSALPLSDYEILVHNDLVGWICRRCPGDGLIHFEAALDEDGRPTHRGITVADLSESAREHHEERHADA